MVEAVIHLKLHHHISILDVYKVFEHIGILSIGIWGHPSTFTTAKGPRFGQSQMMLVDADIHTSDCFPYPYYTYARYCLCTLACCPQAYVSTLKPLRRPCWPIFGHSGLLLKSNDVITSWLSLTSISDCFPFPHQTYSKCV